ncbi:endomucin isoform X1 [Ranitomeya variabilis]|uniref:endomucin isoform X1 n=1 Tax=Ranitomeya variabilis TaxID=490064 RepID=UPI00405687AB
MKTIGADTLFLSGLILLTALLNNVNGEDENQTTAIQTTSSGHGVLAPTSVVPAAVPINITLKTENGSSPTPSPDFHTTSTSDLRDNRTKNETEVTIKANNTTDEYHPANSRTLLTNGNLTTISWTTTISSHVNIKPSDEKMDNNSTAGQDHNFQSPDVSSDNLPTERKGTKQDDGNDLEGDAPPAPSNSKKGIIIGIGCVLAAVVFVVLIFLFKMCQKKTPAAENSEIKVSTQTKENVKLLSVKTATPYSDSKRMTSNQMESIEC